MLTINRNILILVWLWYPWQRKSVLKCLIQQLCDIVLRHSGSLQPGFTVKSPCFSHPSVSLKGTLCVWMKKWRSFESEKVPWEVNFRVEWCAFWQEGFARHTNMLKGTLCIWSIGIWRPGMKTWSSLNEMIKLACLCSQWQVWFVYHHLSSVC